MQGEAIGMALLMHLEIWQEATYAVEHMATTTTTGADTDGSGAYVKIEGRRGVEWYCKGKQSLRGVAKTTAQTC